MMNKQVVISVLLLWGIAVFAQKKSNRFSREDYIAAYANIAVREMKNFGIPASITLAQGILESDCGNSRLAVEGNNHFGIKCHEWTGSSILNDDDLKGECFRKYKHAEESFIDHSLFLSQRSRYAPLFNLKITDYKGWAYGLKQAGYATNPQYANLLIKIIEDNQLYKFDSNEKTSQPQDFIILRKSFFSSRKIAITSGYDIRQYNDVKFVRLKDGDTFGKVASDFKMTEKELRAYNDFDSRIKPFGGLKVYLEPKRRKAAKGLDIHTVLQGETMLAISQAYAIKLKTLYWRNRMRVGMEPIAGEKLMLNGRKSK